MYQLIVKNRAGNVIGEFESFRKLSFGKKVNDYGSCSFEVPIKNPKIASLISLRQYSVWVYRLGELIWSGEQAVRSARLNENSNNWATIYCYGWFELLEHRYLSSQKTYDQIEAGEIAWDLIDTLQADSDMGILKGDIAETMLRDRTYDDTQNVYEAIVNLTNVINGFDFEINDNKVFNVYEEIGVDRTDLILEYGYNIKTVDITEDFKNPVNRAIVLGDSGDIEDPLRITRNNTDLQALYGVREGLLNEMMVTEISTLQEKGDALIRKRGNELFRVTLDLIKSSFPTIGDFALGDTITLKIQNGIYNIERPFRIYEWSINYEDTGVEILDLVLGDFK